MSLREGLTGTLTHPTPETLWRLRAELLEAGVAPGARVWRVIEEYQRFLQSVLTGSSSRHYSDLASKLDIGSITGVVVDRFFEAKDARNLARSLLSGFLSEGLMVLATRQHVRAWEESLGAVCSCASWFLYRELWDWSQEKNPGLATGERRRMLDKLFTPLCSREAAGPSKAVLIGSLFQLLLLSHTLDELDRTRQQPPPGPTPA
jgi:hypothetical protein